MGTDEREGEKVKNHTRKEATANRKARGEPALGQEVAQETYGPKKQSSGVANTRSEALATDRSSSNSCYPRPSDKTEGSHSSGERERQVGLSRRNCPEHMIVHGCQGLVDKLKIRNEWGDP